MNLKRIDNTAATELTLNDGTVANDYPLEEVAVTAEQAIARGATIFQKWTCEGCGDRVTGNTPNKLFTHGHHEDCEHVTDLRVAGCNFMAMYSTGEQAS